MGSRATWRETGQRRMEITYRPGWFSRLLALPFASVPFLLASSLPVGGWRELPTPVMLIQVLFGLAFFTIAWTVMFRSQTIYIHAGDHYIEDTVSYVLWRKSRRISTDDVARIIAEVHTAVVRQKRGTRTIRMCQIRLVDNQDDLLLRLPFWNDRTGAHEVGLRLADILERPLDSTLAPEVAE